ncbi:MAG TPA: TonB-dependent receptor [Flavobacteriaceae bacterium]|nr:TonB-dependent receptor [Flavobacteriaceae bacterium]
MTRKIITILLLMLCHTVFAQEDSTTVSIEFNNVDLLTAISKIEENTDMLFFYDTDWFAEYDKKFTEQYKNAPLKQVLKDIFQGTSLNFILYRGSVILTNNNYIYSELPPNYFGTRPDTLNSTQETNGKQPVFYQEFEMEEPFYVQKKQEDKSLLFIGKETKKNPNNTFQLTGYVRNMETGKPASLILVRTKDGKFSDITNENGFYTLNLPIGLNTIQVESIGYLTASRKIMMFSDGTLDFDLVESVNELDQIVLYGNRDENVRTAVTGVTTIKIEELKKVPMVLGVPDVLKVALLMPGIKNTGEGAAGFNVRGGKTDQNLILLDDATIYNPFHFFGFFSAVNSYAVGSLDIYKGNIPAEFGGRLSSVFDIQTETPNMERITGEAGLGPVNGNILVSIPVIKEKASVSIGGRYAYADWILRSLNNSSLEGSEASFYDINFKYEHILNPNNKIEATGYYSHDQFSITSDSLYKYHNRLISLRWNHEFNNRHSGDLYLTSSEYKFTLEYTPDPPNAYDFGYKINETKVKFKFDYELNDKHTLTYGVSSKLYQINPGYLDPTDAGSLLIPIDIDDEKGLESAVYLSDAFEISDKLLLSAGLRYSYFMALGKSTQRIYDPNLPKSDASVIAVKEFGKNETIETYGGLEVRLGARYLFTDDFSVKASYNTSYQYVHLLSTNTTQSPLDTWTLSNLNIEPQSAEQYSLGLFKNFKNAMYEVSIEGYYKDMHNLLDYKTGAELFLNDNFETSILQGEGKAYGIEFLVRKNLGELSGWLGYTYSRSLIKLDGEFNEEIVNNGEYFPTNFDKPHDFSLVLNYKFTERYSVSANFIYQTGRPVTFPVGTFDYGNAQYTLYSDRNQYRIPDYYRLDLGVNIYGNHKKNNLGRSFWNISVYNVFGRNNPYSVYFVTDDGEIKGYQTSIFSVPIPTVTYNFKF